MGHVESGGAVAGAETRDLTEHAIWPLWRRLAAEFRTWRLLKEIFGSGTAWGLYGVDLAGGLRRTAMARGAERVLAGVDAKTLAELRAIAEVNVRRNDAMWKLAIMFYVTVPVTIFIVGLDAAPEVLVEILRPVALWLVFLLPAFTLQLLFYYATHWRAQQIVGVLDLIRIERGYTT